jgi:hypothetical protein
MMSIRALSPHHRRRAAWMSGWALAVGVLLNLCLSGGRLHAQESSLRFEKTIDFKTAKAADLTAKVGPIRVSSVEFSNLGRGFGHGGFAGKMRPGTLSEVSTTLRAHFLAENPSSDEWEITFTLEYLDKNGKTIERVTKKSSWEGEAKPYDFDHEILDYVVPMIAQVKIKMEGRLD